MIISKTPLRISFVGGGSDLRAYYSQKPGAVLSSTIDKYIYVIVSGRIDNKIRVSYSKTEWTASVDAIEHNIIREALKLAGVKNNVDVSYVGDIPLRGIGTGLGTSSALAVGALNALYAYQGLKVSAAKLAEDACRLEIETLGSPIGKQDQYIVAYGGFNHIKFNTDDTVDVDPVNLRDGAKNELNKRLLMFYSGFDSDSKVVLNEQRARTANNLDILDKMVALTLPFKASLLAGDFSNLGLMLHENWLFKKQLASKISNPLLDGYYEKALRAGAAGGKILGSGGGGFFLFFCQPERQSNLKKALNDLEEVQFKFTPEGTKIIPL